MRLIKSNTRKGITADLDDTVFQDEVDELYADKFEEADKVEKPQNHDRTKEPIEKLDFEEFEVLKELGFADEQLAGLSSIEAAVIIAAFQEDEEAAMRAYKPRRKRGRRVQRVTPKERLERMRKRRKNRFKLRHKRRKYYRKNRHQIKQRKKRKSRMVTPRTVIDRRYKYTYK